MIDRRRAIRFAFAAVSAAWLMPFSTARAQQSFQRFIPFLVDLDGWKGNKADGMALEMAGSSMITAARKYERGPARFEAQVLTGPAAMGILAGTRAGLKLETSEMHMSTSTIDGLQVTKTFTTKDKSGAIIVALGTSAAFSVTFNGVAEDEALTLARKFDWKAIATALPK